MCGTPRCKAGKLDTLGAKGQATEGDPIKAPDKTVIGIYPVNAVPAYSVRGRVYDRDTTFILDTGAAVSLLRGNVWDEARPPETTGTWLS